VDISLEKGKWRGLNCNS